MSSLAAHHKDLHASGLAGASAAGPDCPQARPQKEAAAVGPAADAPALLANRSRHWWLAVTAAAVTAATVTLQALPSAAAVLQYDRAMLAAGQLWRILSCHLTHWSWSHLCWDLLVLLALGSLAGDPRLDLRPGQVLKTMLSASLVISAGVWLCLPQMQWYRGLSGLDCALAGLLATVFACRCWALRRQSRAHRAGLWAVAPLALFFVGKLAFEMSTGSCLFVSTGGQAFVPVPLAHLLGAITGGASGLLSSGAGCVQAADPVDIDLHPPTPLP